MTDLSHGLFVYNLLDRRAHPTIWVENPIEGAQRTDIGALYFDPESAFVLSCR